ncbi:hypothetical protein LOD99_11218, partial [Oopsacas minuta]
MKRLHAVQPSQECIECDFEEFESFDSNIELAIGQAQLQDYGTITPEEDSQIIDRNKLRRSRFSVRKELANEAHETINDISAIYFDGCKDQTRVLVEREDGHLHQDTTNEEHYTVLSEPGNQYVAHVTPSFCSAKDIPRELTDLCRERNSNLMAVGADGTRVNTGIYNGCIKLLELEFTKPLHWFICQLY